MLIILNFHIESSISKMPIRNFITQIFWSAMNTQKSKCQLGPNIKSAKFRHHMKSTLRYDFKRIQLRTTFRRYHYHRKTLISTRRKICILTVINLERTSMTEFIHRN